jgi:UDP-N-acetylmuramyl pentapeptide phosphotransferase/UDP-N-acetylglucosamine-1-phosphate transferase
VSRRRSAPNAFVTGALSAAAVSGIWAGLQRSSAATEPASTSRWTRSNYRDRDVSLLLGPAVGLGAIAGVAVAAPTARRAALLVVSSAAAIGAYDDLYGSRHARGLGGHARALQDGRITTGMVKAVTLVGVGGIGSAVRYRNAIDAALGTVLVAGGANLVNLFDLRPGRAAKVTTLAAAVLSRSRSRETSAVAAVAAGAALAALPADLAERAMMGDCGAGTLGAVLGWSAGMSGSRRRRAVLSAGVIALTFASERVSFSTVIDEHPALRALDQLGRQAT